MTSFLPVKSKKKGWRLLLHPTFKFFSLFCFFLFCPLSLSWLEEKSYSLGIGVNLGPESSCGGDKSSGGQEHPQFTVS